MCAVASSPLTVDGLVGRQIKLLGRRQQVANATGGVQTIFTTGDLDYPCKSNFIAYVGIVSSDGLAITSTLNIGASGANDWTGGNVALVAQASPVVLYCGMASSGSLTQPVYSQGIPFQVTFVSGAGGAQTLEFSAYGWAF